MSSQSSRKKVLQFTLESGELPHGGCMTDISKLSFIKKAPRVPFSDLKLVKRKDGGFSEHPSMFFKRRCLHKFTDMSMQDIAAFLDIEYAVIELFMEAKLAVDPELAKKLSKGTNFCAATWLELQRQYDEYNKQL